MKYLKAASILLVLLFSVKCATVERPAVSPGFAESWRAVHLLDYNSDTEVKELEGVVPKLAAMGVNVFIFEVDYNFAFQSHPELRRGETQLTKAGAGWFVDLCKKHNIRVIPEFQCLGHQSWKKETFPLLTRYPEFDLTPGAFPENRDIYCREWDLMNPAVNKIIFKLMDEIIEAFSADAFHIGMDEVFLLGSQESPSTRGMDPGKLYARAINDYHGHLVKKRGVEMLMWGDRLIDGKKYEYGEWESSINGTATAVDNIPKDIIICDWHYEKMDAYPSIQMFIKKGFRVLPTSWRKVDASRALIEHSLKVKDGKMLGHLFTIWGKTKLLEWKPLRENISLLSPDK